MSLWSMIHTWRRQGADRLHHEEVDREIEESRARVRQDVQILQSGSRVMSTMAGMMDLMSKLEDR